jgi:hypothetical protein
LGSLLEESSAGVTGSVGFARLGLIGILVLPGSTLGSGLPGSLFILSSRVPLFATTFSLPILAYRLLNTDIITVNTKQPIILFIDAHCIWLLSKKTETDINKLLRVSFLDQPCILQVIVQTRQFLLQTERNPLLTGNIKYTIGNM